MSDDTNPAVPPATAGPPKDEAAPAAAPAAKPAAPAAAAPAAAAGGGHGTAHAPGRAAVPAFPSGEAVFPEEPPLVPAPDFGHYALQATLWGMVVVCAAFVVIGCVRTFGVILDYAR